MNRDGAPRPECPKWIRAVCPGLSGSGGACSNPTTVSGKARTVMIAAATVSPGTILRNRREGSAIARHGAIIRQGHLYRITLESGTKLTGIITSTSFARRQFVRGPRCCCDEPRANRGRQHGDASQLFLRVRSATGALAVNPAARYVARAPALEFSATTTAAEAPCSRRV